MQSFRITCERCGLSATHLRSGGRSMTSFDAEQCEARCEIAKAATGDRVAACMGQCPHLAAALAMCEAGGAEPPTL
jgi:hypothetical protein